MGRKVALIGAALAAAGILILLWTQPAPQVSATLPIHRLTNVVLSFLPLVGLMGASVGGIMIALAVVGKVTGRLPVWGNPPALVWLGLGAVVLASVVEVGVLSVIVDSAQPTSLLAVSHGAGVFRTIGAALLAWWLTAQIAGYRSSEVWRREGSVDGASVGA